MNNLKFIIITGISGAGKSQAINHLEDLGFFCIDNLPTTLIPKLTEIYQQSTPSKKPIVLGIDVREGDLLDELFSSLTQLKDNGFEFQIIFLDANDETLIRRFSETRRKHPLKEKEKTIIEAIKKERKLLLKIKEKADKIIDTSNLTPKEFRERILSIFQTISTSTEISIMIISFGYKYGIPQECDIIFDTRFLANPFYIETLKLLDGNDKEVINFLLKKRITRRYIKKCNEILNLTIPYFIKEGKSYLTIGVGCTGGRHRSVVISNELKKSLEKKYFVQIKYRDIEK